MKETVLVGIQVLSCSSIRRLGWPELSISVRWHMSKVTCEMKVWTHDPVSFILDMISPPLLTSWSAAHICHLHAVFILTEFLIWLLFLTGLMAALTIIQKTKNHVMQSFKTVHQLNWCELKKQMVVFIYIKVLLLLLLLLSLFSRVRLCATP